MRRPAAVRAQELRRRPQTPPGRRSRDAELAVTSGSLAAERRPGHAAQRPPGPARGAAAALRNGGRFTTWPINFDSRTSARTRGRRNAANRAERRRQVAGPVDEAGQDRGVLDPLTAALAQMRPHRVRRVPDRDDRPARPLPGLVAVIEVVAQHIVGIGRRQHSGDGIGPRGELGLQIGRARPAARRVRPARARWRTNTCDPIRAERGRTRCRGPTPRLRLRDRCVQSATPRHAV